MLDIIIVDSAIRDVNGREFWTKNFLKKEEISWNEFVTPFLKYIGAAVENDTKEINIKCLHAILGNSIETFPPLFYSNILPS